MCDMFYLYTTQMILIDCKGDVNASDNDGNRPVHLAALNGHEEVGVFGVNLLKTCGWCLLL